MAAYYEPFVLILFAIVAARLTAVDAPPASSQPRRIRWANLGPLLLTGILAAITVAALR